MPALNTNAQAFEAAVAPYERQVYFTCLRIMGNPQDAEDCAQEAMLKAYHAFAGFRGDSKASTWLYTIATRCCMDALRRRREVVSLDSLDGFVGRELGAVFQEVAEQLREVRDARCPEALVHTTRRRLGHRVGADQ